MRPFIRDGDEKGRYEMVITDSEGVKTIVKLSYKDVQILQYDLASFAMRDYHNVRK